MDAFTQSAGITIRDHRKFEASFPTDRDASSQVNDGGECAATLGAITL